MHNTRMKSMKAVIQSCVCSCQAYSKPAVLSEDLLGQLACATPMVDL